jgi:hypothetical protein
MTRGNFGAEIVEPIVVFKVFTRINSIFVSSGSGPEILNYMRRV